MNRAERRRHRVTLPPELKRKGPKPDLLRRQEALVKTQLRFAGKAFDLGTADCVQLGRYHLRAMGHRKVPATGTYKTPLGARKALKKAGADNLAGLLDKLLPRIAPAAMLPGDLALVMAEPNEEAADIGTLVIYVGGRKYLGWHPDKAELAVMEISAVEAAWRA